MANKDQRPKARLPRGFADRSAGDIRATEKMLATIREVYERYGFEPVETPLIEYTDALGKFLPDQDRPNEGVFSFQDDDEQWLSLRYDLTAPLARYVAENYERLPKPYRSYRAGWVFRNEKPGPGRFRQFMQFDADTVGASSVAADAEMCMMAADTLEALRHPARPVRDQSQFAEAARRGDGDDWARRRRECGSEAHDALAPSTNWIDSISAMAFAIFGLAAARTKAADFTRSGCRTREDPVDRILEFAVAHIHTYGGVTSYRSRRGRREALSQTRRRDDG